MAYGAAGEAAGPIPGDTVQLRTLTRIRWVAIAGQVAALTVVHYGLGFPVPFGPARAAAVRSPWCFGSGSGSRSATKTAEMSAIDNHDDRTLLIVDDDLPFRSRLARAMRKRGFQVSAAASVAAGIDSVRKRVPAFAVLDLRLEDGNGLDAVAAIRDERPDSRIVMLTGYANIATAVAAVKAGAVDYLAKPTDADAVEAALLSTESASPPEHPMSAERVRWEHILRVYEQCDRNISESARRLGMHRRTLQRILSKRAPRESGDA